MDRALLGRYDGGETVSAGERVAHLVALPAVVIDHVVIDDVAGVTVPGAEDFIGNADSKAAEFDECLRDAGAVIRTVGIVKT